VVNDCDDRPEVKVGSRVEERALKESVIAAQGAILAVLTFMFSLYGSRVLQIRDEASRLSREIRRKQLSVLRQPSSTDRTEDLKAVAEDACHLLDLTRYDEAQRKSWQGWVIRFCAAVLTGLFGWICLGAMHAEGRLGYWFGIDMSRADLANVTIAALFFMNLAVCVAMFVLVLRPSNQKTRQYIEENGISEIASRSCACRRHVLQRQRRSPLSHSGRR
jgi:hypothetical protein